MQHVHVPDSVLRFLHANRLWSDIKVWDSLTQSALICLAFWKWQYGISSKQWWCYHSCQLLHHQSLHGVRNLWQIFFFFVTTTTKNKATSLCENDHLQSRTCAFTQLIKYWNWLQCITNSMGTHMYVPVYIQVNKHQSKCSVHPPTLRWPRYPLATICPVSFLAPIRQTQQSRHKHTHTSMCIHTLGFKRMALIMFVPIILLVTITSPTSQHSPLILQLLTQTSCRLRNTSRATKVHAYMAHIYSIATALDRWVSGWWQIVANQPENWFIPVTSWFSLCFSNIHHEMCTPDIPLTIKHHFPEVFNVRHNKRSG